MRPSDLKFQTAEDRLSWWKRLLGSLRLRLKPGRTLRRPISSVMLTGKVEF